MSAPITEFRGPEGDILVWVFPSPGRIWKDRWVAFTNSDQFQYFKGSREEVFKWTERYLLNA